MPATFILTNDHVSLTEDPYTVVTEASTLGCSEWPREIWTTLGNAQPFLRVSKRVDAEGETMYVRYRQQLGNLSLKVFND